MKIAVQTKMSLSALLVTIMTLVSACTMGLDPAWKSVGTTLSFGMGSGGSSRSAESRALIQGSGFLYICADTTVYGPYLAAASKMFTTSDVPAGTYGSIKVVFSASVLDRAWLVRELSSAPSWSDLAGNLAADYSGLLSGNEIEDFTIEPEKANVLSMTLLPVVAAAHTADFTSSTQQLTLPSTGNGSGRRFVSLLNLQQGFEAGRSVTKLTLTASASTGTLIPGTMDFFDASGKKILAGVQGVTAGGATTYTLLPSAAGLDGDDYYVYLEYACNGTAGVTLALSRELSELTPGTTYTVSYDGNLGTGTVPSSSVTEGDSCTAAANGFTRSGYEFAGWATSAAGAAVYKPGDSVTPTANLTLYAVWTAVPAGDSGSFALTLTGATTLSGRTLVFILTDVTLSAMTETTIPLAMGHAAVSSTGVATATGLDLADGTSTASIPTGSYYLTALIISDYTETTEGVDISPVTGDYYLYDMPVTIAAGANAKSLDLSAFTLLSETAVLSVSYDGNGGTGTVSPTQVIAGESCAASANAFARSGYEFAGWATSASGAVVYKPGDLFFPTADLTLYAVWTAVEVPTTGTAVTVNIYFNGTEPVISPSSTTVVKGSLVTLTVSGTFASCQWYAGGDLQPVAIAGATGTSYTIDTSTLDAGVHEFILEATDSSLMTYSANCYVKVTN